MCKGDRKIYLEKYIKVLYILVCIIAFKVLDKKSTMNTMIFIMQICNMYPMYIATDILKD